MSAKVPGRGHTHKHTKTSKAGKKPAKHRPNHHKAPATHHGTGHKVTTKAHHAHHAKAVGFALDGLPVCAFEAVAMSLRLAGQPVSGDEVAHLWELCGSPAEGVPVGEALAAAALFGLSGFRPVVAECVGGGHAETGALARGAIHECLKGARQQGVTLPAGDLVAADEVGTPSHQVAARRGPLAYRALAPMTDADLHGLILRIDVPGPHAVLATADGWWSWGELHSPWPCRVSEAWAVSWS